MGKSFDMKRYYLLLAFLATMVACKKEEEIFISGKVVNTIDNKAVSNLRMTLGYSEFFGIGWQYKQLASDFTDSKGEFELSYKEEVHFLSLKPHLNIDQIGNEFQRGARINGKYYRMLCFRIGFDGLENNGYYVVELLPVTKAYFLKPTIPLGWGADTLILNVENLVLNPGSNGGECGVDTSAFAFRLVDQEGWKDLKIVRNLFLGDELNIHYTIKNGGIKKSGTFKKSCIPGDTTAVELPIW